MSRYYVLYAWVTWPSWVLLGIWNLFSFFFCENELLTPVTPCDLDRGQRSCIICGHSHTSLWSSFMKISPSIYELSSFEISGRGVWESLPERKKLDKHKTLPFAMTTALFCESTQSCRALGLRFECQVKYWSDCSLGLCIIVYYLTVCLFLYCIYVVLPNKEEANKQTNKQIQFEEDVYKRLQSILSFTFHTTDFIYM